MWGVEDGGSLQGRGEKGDMSPSSWAVGGLYTDYAETMAHFTQAALCEARKRFVFSDGNEWILLMGSRQLWETVPRETGNGIGGRG